MQCAPTNKPQNINDIHNFSISLPQFRSFFRKSLPFFQKDTHTYKQHGEYEKGRKNEEEEEEETKFPVCIQFFRSLPSPIYYR